MRWDCLGQPLSLPPEPHNLSIFHQYKGPTTSIFFLEMVMHENLR